MGGKNCGAVLIPTEETMKDDYMSAMAYVYQNAAYDYERVVRNNSGAAGLGIAYERFSLDFNQANSAQDFQTRVRSRLVEMGFTMSTASARSYTKRGLSQEQIQGWLECEQGGVILSVSSIDRKRATIQLDYRSGPGVTTHNLVLRVAGGSFDGSPPLSVDIFPNDSKTYIVNRGEGEEITRVTATVGGYSDYVDLDFALADRPIGMLGSTLNIARRSPYRDTPYPLWVPRDINVTALAAPTRWVATNVDYMNVAVGAFTITFEIAHESLYHYESTPEYPFDGFVITGFRNDIAKATVSNLTPLRVELETDERQIAVNLFGRSDAGKSFVLQIEFKQPATH